MTVRASITNREAWLGSDFGLELARRYFTEEQIASLPRYSRGKNKGKIKGIIRWKKVERGGWIFEGSYYGESIGRVENRVGKIIQAELCSSEFDQEPKVVATYKREK